MDQDRAIKLLEDALVEWRTIQTRAKENVSINRFAEHIGISKALLIALQERKRPFTYNTREKIAQPIAKLVGPEAYEILEIIPPNPYLQKINQSFKYIAPEFQRKLAEDAERYKAENHENNKATPSRRKTQHDQ